MTYTRCDNCLYYIERCADSTKHGECRRHAPQPVVVSGETYGHGPDDLLRRIRGTQGVARWPIVLAGDCCGDWQRVRGAKP